MTSATLAGVVSASERVSHDRRVRPAFDALEIVDIALRTAGGRLDARNSRAVVVVECERAGLNGLVEVSRVTRADNDARHAGLIEGPAERDRADADAVARRYVAENRQHVLKTLPAVPRPCSGRP